MSDVKIFRVTNRLKTLIRKPGGIMARDAIMRAEAAMEACYPAAIASIDANLAELMTLSTAKGQQDNERVYKLSSQIIDLAIALPGSGIEAGARALCDLADLATERGVWDQEAVAVHVQAIFLLRHEGKTMSPNARARVADGLRRVMLKRLGGPAEAAEQASGS